MKFKKNCWIIIAVLAILFSLFAILCCMRLIGRVAQIRDVASYYHIWELALLLTDGSGSDRREAQTVLDLAETAFADLTHTREENQQAYGPLARYATTADRGAVSQTHTLDLWSAHLRANKGYLWVYYSSEAFYSDGETVHGSWRIPSLWTVEKDKDGNWAVTKIKEHP